MPTEGACKAGEAKEAVSVGVTDPRRTLRKCCFADILNCLGIRDAWNWHLKKGTGLSKVFYFIEYPKISYLINVAAVFHG